MAKLAPRPGVLFTWRSLEKDQRQTPDWTPASGPYRKESVFLWTAILGGVLFATAARYRRPRLTRAVLGWYVLVALLHALWDASAPIAAWLTLQLTATPVQRLLIDVGRVPPWSHVQVHLFTALSWALLAFDALVGQ